jgi:hypothetical protein
MFSLDSKARCAIGYAMNQYHKNTCIRFVPRTNQKDYIHIRKIDSTGYTFHYQNDQPRLHILNYFLFVEQLVMLFTGTWLQQRLWSTCNRFYAVLLRISSRNHHARIDASRRVRSRADSSRSRYLYRNHLGSNHSR